MEKRSVEGKLSGNAAFHRIFANTFSSFSQITITYPPWLFSFFFRRVIYFTFFRGWVCGCLEDVWRYAIVVSCISFRLYIEYVLPWLHQLVFYDEFTILFTRDEKDYGCLDVYLRKYTRCKLQKYLIREMKYTHVVIFFDLAWNYYIGFNSLDYIVNWNQKYNLNKMHETTIIIVVQTFLQKNLVDHFDVIVV